MVIDGESCASAYCVPPHFRRGKDKNQPVSVAAPSSFAPFRASGSSPPGMTEPPLHDKLGPQSGGLCAEGVRSPFSWLMHGADHENCGTGCGGWYWTTVVVAVEDAVAG